MTAPSMYGPRAARPAPTPPTWPPFDPETGQFVLDDETDPPEGFFVDPDIAMRMAEAATVAEGLSPADAWRDSNRKRSEFTRAQWDLDVRRRAYEEAEAFSFDDPAEDSEPVLAELSPEDSAKFGLFSGLTNLQVDFPPEHGGYIARVWNPAENVEVGRFPRRFVLHLTDDIAESGSADDTPNVPDATRDSEDEDGWFSGFLTSERIRDLILDSLPGIGNVRSGFDAYESWREAIEAARREDWDAFLEHGGMGLLNTIGAVGGPFGGPLVRLIKAGIRYLADATPGVRQAVAAHDLKRAAKRFDKTYRSIRVEKVLGEAYHRLPAAQKKRVKGIFPNILGTAGERHAVRQLDRAGQPVTRQGPKTTTTVNVNGRPVKRRYDALIEKVQHNVFVDGFKVFHPKTRRAAVEVKVQNSKLGRQKKADEVVAKEGTFADEILHLRYPVKAIPEKEFERVARDMFSKHISNKPGGLSQKDVDRIVGKLKRLRRDGSDEITAEIVIGIGARLAANAIAEKQPTGRRDKPRQDGWTMEELATGA